MRNLLTLFLFGLPLVAAGADQSVTQQFIGVWKLVSYELRAPSGALSYPLGNDPVGRITYDAEGRMSAQLMRRNPPNFSNDDRRKATTEEMVAAWRGYVGYFGTYTVDEKAGTVIHHVEAAWFPNFVGTEQVRHFKLQSDRLTLESDQAGGGRATLVWRRTR